MYTLLWRGDGVCTAALGAGGCGWESWVVFWGSEELRVGVGDDVVWWFGDLEVKGRWRGGVPILC